MTTGNAKIWILNAVQDYVDEHHGQPKAVRIPTTIALDLCKLTRDEIGDISEDLFKNGIDALKERKLFGYKMIVDPDAEDITCE